MAFGSGSDDCTCRLFDIRADRELMQYKANDKVVTSLTFSLSGRYLFGSYEDPVIRVWDTLRGETVGDLKGHSQRVSSVGLSSDGCALASGSWDNMIKVNFFLFLFLLLTCIPTGMGLSSHRMTSASLYKQQQIK